MKRLLYTTIFLMSGIWFTACRSIGEIPIESRTDSIYIEKLIPVITPADSAAIRALFECDESGKVVLRWLDIANTKNVQAQLTIDSLGNVIAKMKVPSDTVYVPSKEVYIDREVQVPYPVEKKLTKWQAVKVELGGWAFGIIICFVLFVSGWLLYKKLRK